MIMKVIYGNTLFASTPFSKRLFFYETLNVDPNDIHANYSDDQFLNVHDEIKEARV